MGWASLIAALISFLGPYIEKWLASCAEKRAERVAQGLPDFASYPDESTARRALLEAMIDDLPRWARVRKAALTRAAAVLEKHDVTSKSTPTALAPNDEAELRNLFDMTADE